jgi:hypothetical protein
MFDNYLAAMKIIASSEEFFETLSKMYHNFYLQLLARGFSEDEALKIICSSNIMPKSGG